MRQRLTLWRWSLRAHCMSAQSSYHIMASLLKILLELLHRLRPVKDHTKRFLRCWTSFFAYLVRKMGEWRFHWPGKLGTIRSPKPAEPSFSSDSAGSSSVSGGSVCTGGIGGYVVAASTVPASADQPLGRGRDELQSDTAPPTPILATIPVDPPWVLGHSMANQTVGSSHTNRRSRSLSIQSRASDRLSIISRTSSRGPFKNDRLSQDPRATHRQFGTGPRASPSRGRSSRSPSLKPFLDLAQLDNLDIDPTDGDTYPHAGGVFNPTIGLQGLTDFPSSSSHTQERPGRPAVRRQKQREINIGLNVQIPSTESLPITLIDAQKSRKSRWPWTRTHSRLVPFRPRIEPKQLLKILIQLPPRHQSSPHPKVALFS